MSLECVEGHVPPSKGDVTRVCPSLEEGLCVPPSRRGQGALECEGASDSHQRLPHPSSREGHPRV